MGRSRFGPKVGNEVQIQNTVSLAIAVVGMQKMDTELAQVQTKVGRFRNGLESSGLGTLNVSGLLKGGGLFAPFVAGINSAIAAQNEFAKQSAAEQGFAEPESAMGETQNNLNQLSESVTQVSVEFGNALLPAVNAIAVALVPMVSKVAELLAKNPQLVQGLAMAAVAFVTMQGAVTGVLGGMNLLKSALLTSPVGLIALGIAVAAGLIIANWKPISAFFARLWEGIKAVAAPVIDFFKTMFSWMPLGMIIQNWGALSGLFSAIWNLLVALAQPVLAFFKTMFDWSPLGMIVANWQPISEVFATLWEGLKALTAPVVDALHEVFNWTPMGMIIKNWGGITEWFSKMWEKVKEIFGSIKEMLGGTFGGFLGKLTGTVDLVTEKQEQVNESFGWGKRSDLPKASADLPKTSTNLLQQSATNNRAQLEGGFTVRFENAPAGMRADAPQSNQPNLLLTSRIGYRSLSLGGSHDSQLA